MDHRASSIRWLYPMLIDSFVFFFFFFGLFLNERLCEIANSEDTCSETKFQCFETRVKPA